MRYIVKKCGCELKELKSFHKDVMELSSRELSILGEIGKAVHYKNNYKGNSSVTSYSSRFYLLLQRIK